MPSAWESGAVLPTPLVEAWTLPPEVTYLNHGSFGPTPLVVQQARAEWSARLAAQPMDFYLRQMEPALDAAAERLGRFVGADARDLVFVDNATAAMNIVAATVPLADGDEVLLNNHEYGAVRRIWQRACRARGAKLVTAEIPTPLRTEAEILEPLFAAVTPRTRLIVVSQVTSPTAIVFPVEAICRRAAELGLPVCIDGPHAIAMRPVEIRRLGCEFYCASLHKWLSAPLGTGFLYVERGWQSAVQSPMLSWGRSVGGRAARWQDEIIWQGSRDPAGFLAVPAAIEFLESIGLEQFRRHGHALAQYARRELEALFGSTALVPDDAAWYGTMITVPLPAGPSRRPQPNAADPLQRALWERFRIEAPVVDWRDRRHLRVSAHLYNDAAQIERLVASVRELLAAGC